MRKTVGARELKTRLGKYLRAVRGGTTIVVTERGEPVAEMRPIGASPDSVEARRDRLAALGILTKGSGQALGKFDPVEIRGERASRTVIDDREDRF